MELPPPLRPWAPALELFPRDLALSLGSWLLRLSAAIGPLRSTPGHGGEPDGYAGLARRGPYERLLASEWAVADEHPNEFWRRAVGGEHAFLELARRDPSGSRRCVALLDAGPEQLGPPRLVHVALLILLERRAVGAGASFAWGLLQDAAGAASGPDDGPPTAATFERLLAGRSTHDPSPAAAAEWRARLGTVAATDDVWVVGGDAARSVVREWGVSHLTVVDPVEPGARRLDFEVVPRGGRRAAVQLELPPDELCTRLLRDPFARAAPAVGSGPAGVVLGGGMVFARGSTRLLTRSLDGRVAAWHVPNSPRSRTGRTRYFAPAPGRYAIAAGYDGKSLMVVTAADPSRGEAQVEPADGPLVVHRGAGRQPLGPLPNLSLPRPHDALSSCFASVSPARAADGTWFTGREVYVQTEYGQMVFAVPGSRPASVLSVYGAVPFGGGALIAERRGRSYFLRASSDPRQPMETELEGDGDFKTFISCTTPPSRLVVAIRRNVGRWSLYTGYPLTSFGPELHMGVDAEVVGVTRIPEGDYPALVVLESDGRLVSLVSTFAAVPLPRSLSRIVDVCVDPSGRFIAYQAADSSVTVYSLPRRAVVLQLAGVPIAHRRVEAPR